ncbi:interferon-related developmental regulator 2-like [Watersipora subatra]|uniref:interferon-related developmental regulator 2-like n=1 Tax=Watersipora subatra TaxID=2589382 RepID=UPI00355AD5DC
MPKKNRKRGKTEAGVSAAAEGMDDAMSTTSHGSLSSEQSLDPFADAVVDDGADDLSAQVSFEEKLGEAIEGILEKSLKARVNSIKSVCSAMRKRILTDFLVDRYVTLTDALERSLKKGKGDEQANAATGLMLLSIQLGLTDEGEAAFHSFQPTLQALMLDPSASFPARAQCAEALGLCGFIAANDLEVIADLMSKLESVFVKSYLKGDKTPPSLSPQTCNLHRAAIEAWNLLLSISTPNSVKPLVDRHLHKLPELLESPDLDVRIAAGESISLLYELAREQDEDFEGPQMNELCEKLRQMSTDNNKHQHKKNRKQQRSSFRDILNSVESGEFAEYDCKVGSESIYIDTWARKRQYDSLCSNLESGMNTHLRDNVLLRDIFGLGAPLPVGPITDKASKTDRKLYNQALFKARTLVRQKQRDKRMAKLSG